MKQELLDLTKKVADTYNVPPIRQVYIPEPLPHENRHTEFGVVELDDGSAGLYYAWLGESQQGMQQRYDPEDFHGADPVEFLPLLNSDNDADRSLAMALINAVTSNFFRQVKYRPEDAGDSLGSLEIQQNDHVGMVGYFPSLIEKLRKNHVRVTVIEKKSRFSDSSDELINVTDTPEALLPCNKILSTASTLLNDTIDEILDNCRNADRVVIVGPTAGFLPDPLFNRNVSAIGGTEIIDSRTTIENLKKDAGLAVSTRKYLIQRDDYPGIDKLLKRVIS